MSASSESELKRSVSDDALEASAEFTFGLQTKAGDKFIIGTEKIRVRHAAYAVATANGALAKWSKESIHLYFSCFTSFLCACANGYGVTLFSGLSSMPHYKKSFLLGVSDGEISLISSIYLVGSILGAFSAGPIADRYGRRTGMFVGAFIVIFGIVVAATSHHIHHLITGRFVLGWGFAILTVSAPSYCLEISPPHWRGKMGGFYNNGLAAGSIPAIAIMFGSQYINSIWSWRVPMIFQGVPAAFVLIFVWFIPESPRWLMMNGRSDEALGFLIKYHGNNDPSSPLVRLEWQEFQEIPVDGSDKIWWDYRPILINKKARWRFAMALMVLTQLSGNGLGYFNDAIYAHLGYDKPGTQLAINLVASSGSVIVGLTAAALSDIMPRVKLLTFGTFVCACLSAINAACNIKWAQTPVDVKGNLINPPLAIGRLGLAAYFLFGIVFTFSFIPLQGVYPVENLENTVRAKGMAKVVISLSLLGFINTYAGPIALAKLKNNYVWILVGFDFIQTGIWWFAGVETIGRTVEELDEIYDAPYPSFASRKFNGMVSVSKTVITL